MGALSEDNADIWITELDRRTLVRLTTDLGSDGTPLWSRDGRRVAFTTDRSGQAEVWWQPADGSGEAEVLVTFEEPVTRVVPYDWLPDGSGLLVAASFDGVDQDIGLVLLDGDRTWQPILQTDADERNPTISPNGRWLAYGSNETAGYEVYVRRFPEGSDRRQISVGGGHTPSWSPDGEELLYLRAPVGAPNAMMRVSVRTAEDDDTSLTVGTPERLFDWTYFSRPGGQRWYDMSADGERFLVIADETINGAPSGGSGVQIHVVLNWFQELTERVPIP